jgi:hypothetical protein
MIVIVEGPPGSKAQETAKLIHMFLSNDDDTNTMVHTNYDHLDPNQQAKLYFSSMTSAITYNKHVVLQGSWLNANIPQTYKQMLDRVALSRNAVVVQCLPSMDACVENEQETEKTEIAYRQFLMFVNKFNDMPTFLYDYENTVPANLLAKLHNIHMSKNPYKGGGRFAEGNILVLCSKWRVTRDIRPTAVVVPYINFNEVLGSTPSASSLITNAFYDAGIPEKDIYWVNVESTAGVPLDPEIVSHMKPRRIIAIGTQPRLWAMSNGLNAEFLSQPNRSDTTLSLF